MRQYDLYRIEEPVAIYYYGRERMFYLLFQEHRWSKGEFKQIVDGQVQYITKNIPVLPLHQVLKEGIKQTTSVKIEGNCYLVQGEKNESEFARMEISENSITVWAEGENDLESIFFDVLRKLDNFLAVDLENDRFGWLKPRKERKYV